jgi:hypothetical protein
MEKDNRETFLETKREESFCTSNFPQTSKKESNLKKQGDMGGKNTMTMKEDQRASLIVESDPLLNKLGFDLSTQQSKNFVYFNLRNR